MMARSSKILEKRRAEGDRENETQIGSRPIEQMRQQIARPGQLWRAFTNIQPIQNARGQDLKRITARACQQEPKFTVVHEMGDRLHENMSDERKGEGSDENEPEGRTLSSLINTHRMYRWGGQSISVGAG